MPRYEFVPRVIATTRGETVVREAGFCWDVTSWMPGTATLRTSSVVELAVAACVSLARLHAAWSGESDHIPCPAVIHRLALFREWETIPAPRTDYFFRECWEAVHARLSFCRRALSEWQNVPVPVHPCLCDVHPDHILFVGPEVAGIIDYGAMRIDSPAQDLARLLGELFVPDSPEFESCVNAYREAKHDLDSELVRVLTETGIVGALANWFVRITNTPAQADDLRVRSRMEHLLHRCLMINPNRITP